MSTETAATPGTLARFVDRRKSGYTLVRGTVETAPDEYGYVRLVNCHPGAPTKHRIAKTCIVHADILEVVA